MLNERITLHFRKGKDGTYDVERFCLERVGEGGASGDRKTATWREKASSGDAYFGQPDSVRVLALAFVRVAQYQFMRIAPVAQGEVPVFQETSDSSVFGKFRNLFDGARKNSDHGSKWLREMLALDDDPRELQLRGRLEQWFTVSRKKPGGVVACDVASLSPDAVSITVDSVTVDEAGLDELESSLALRLNAGLPCRFELEGIVIAGRPPSVRPEWYEQESECAQADAVYARGDIPILCALGPSWTGKTVFATRWLRRLVGNRKARHRFLFAWSFSRQGAQSHIQLPSLGFFRELAQLLAIELPEKSSPAEQANLILDGLASKPTLLFLDGVEATFAGARMKDSERISAERDTGLARMLEGIAAGNGSFILATSQTDFSEAFRLPEGCVHGLHLRAFEPPEIDGFLAQYGKEHLGKEKNAAQSMAIADLCRVLKETSLLTSESISEAMMRAAAVGAGPLSGYSAALADSDISEEKKFILNMILARLQGSCSQLLLYVICVAIDVIGEGDLLAVVEQLPLNDVGLSATKVTVEDWSRALDALIATTILQQATRHVHYSIHRERARYICESLKRNSPALWVAINTTLGKLLLQRSPDEVTKREHVQPLVEAAIYFCQAGKKHIAYDEIGRKRLSRGLKGYVIFHLGEYEAPKAINAAILHRDPDVADVTPVPPEIVVLCLHVLALCSRYLNQLKEAREQERDAWRRAKVVGTPSAILTVGFNLLRLCHMFGDMAEAKEVERVMFVRLFKENLKARVFGRPLDLEKEDVADGASAVSSMLALSILYRGAGVQWVNKVLEAGIKECRDNGESVPFLMPTYGRPWHALALLEMGKWEVCERAFNAQEWFSDMVRFQQTGTFETFAAMLFLGKGNALDGQQRKSALEIAHLWGERALGKATKGQFRWWETLASLTLGRTLAADNQLARAGRYIESALCVSKAESFQLLQVDSLLAKAELAGQAGQFRESAAIAKEGAVLSRSIGYGLRKAALGKIIKAGR